MENPCPRLRILRTSDSATQDRKTGFCMRRLERDSCPSLLILTLLFRFCLLDLILWPVRGFPATQRETRGSPALCVSGSFQGNQRVFGAPFCFSRVSLGKLASFPESESWSGAKSGAKLRKSARYPGIFQVYRGFPGIPAKYPVFCRFWPQNSLRHGSEPPQNDEFHGVSPGFPEETRGCCRETSRKHGKETR